MPTIKREQLDFFVCTRLDGKDATMYVRGGKLFFWCGDEKIEIEETDVPLDEEDQKYFADIGEQAVKVEGMDLTKDRKVDGRFWMWKREQYYGFVFFDDKRKHAPVALKFGNGLEEK